MAELQVTELLLKDNPRAASAVCRVDGFIERYFSRTYLDLWTFLDDELGEPNQSAINPHLDNECS